MEWKLDIAASIKHRLIAARLSRDQVCLKVPALARITDCLLRLPSHSHVTIVLLGYSGTLRNGVIATVGRASSLDKEEYFEWYS